MTRFWMVLVTLGLMACAQEARETAGEEADTTAAVPTQEVDVAAEEEALRDVDRQALRAFQAKDARALGELYAEDAILVNPGQEPVEGRAAIDSIHADEFGAPGYTVDFEALDVRVAESGDLGFVYGRWEGSVEEGGTARKENGYYVNVYEKQDGRWVTTHELNVSSTPPAEGTEEAEE